LSHQTSVATLVAVLGRAVHQVLLGESDESVSGLQDISTFQRTSGGERPAGTALALVFDRSDGILGSPVHGSRHGGVSVSDGSLWPIGFFPFSAADFERSSAVQSAEFISGHVSEFVHGDGIAFGISVVVGDESHV